MAAIERAWQLFGNARWKDLFGPVITATRDGFPLSSACHYYLGYSGKDIFDRSEDGYHALHGEDGALHGAGSAIVVPHLADTLTAIADEGARLFYEGELGQKISAHVCEGGGALTLQDLADFEAIERPSLTVDIGAWTIATNPPPAVGGAVLSAMLLACGDLPHNTGLSQATPRPGRRCRRRGRQPARTGSRRRIAEPLGVSVDSTYLGRRRERHCMRGYGLVRIRFRGNAG